MDESKLKYLNKYTKIVDGKQAKPYVTKNLAKSLWIVKPNWTVFKLFCKTVARKPVTVLYPYQKEWIPENYRGRPDSGSTSASRAACALVCAPLPVSSSSRSLTTMGSPL